MLSAPIILYDYPQIAPESPGDLFDSTEIDEILTLRILTLTDDEKRAMAAVNERARASWNGPNRSRASNSWDFMAPSGASGLSERASNGPLREPWEDRPKLDRIRVAGVEYRVGDRVRIWPLGDADIFDLALKGKDATIAAIEQDYEDRVHVAVTVDDDPGQDLGREGKPGHRFFFRPEELEPIELDEGEGP